MSSTPLRPRLAPALLAMPALLAGAPMVSAAAPELAPIADREIPFRGRSLDVILALSDPDTAVGELVLGGSAEDETLLPAGSLTFHGSGAIRWATITPATGESGATRVTLSVSDGNDSSSRSFTLGVAGPPADPAADEDGDTLTNGEEAGLGTNPFLPDSDGDGSSDPMELTAGTDPLDALSGPGFDPTAMRVATEDAMRRANDYFQANFAIGNEGWERSAYQTGNFRAWQALGYQPYFDRAMAWGVQNDWDHGTDYGDVNGESADAHCCGQIYIDLHEAAAEPDDAWIATITTHLDDLLLDDPGSVDDWWWVDAIYMAAPTLARLAAVHGDEAYLAQMMAMYFDTKERRRLFDPARGLWWRDDRFLDTDVYWGRGNGWAIGACARVLEALPADDPRRPEFEAMLRTMATALLEWQQPDGMWRSSITDPDHPAHDNPETSGTAFFTYGIAYGLNHGILVDGPGRNYTAAAMKAWNGMVAVAQHPGGAIGYIQSVGSAPGPASYNDTGRDYGYGAFLLAGSEILDLLGGATPVFPDAGPDARLVDADGDYAEPLTLDASASQLRSGSVTGYSWWSGGTLLGSGPTLKVDFPLGDNPVRLDLEHSDGSTYRNRMVVSVSPAPAGITASASGFQDPNVPANTLDGDLGTRWSQFGNSGSEWILYELPSTETLDHLDLAFHLGDTRRAHFAVWISQDGSSFTRVLPPAGSPDDYISSSGTTTGVETFSFPGQPASHVRINGWGNSASGWNSITEVAFPLPGPTDQADADGNGLPDSWEVHHFGSAGLDASAMLPGTPLTLAGAYLLGIDPAEPAHLPVLGIARPGGTPELSLDARGAFGVGYQGRTRHYRIHASPDLEPGSWSALPGYEDLIGDNRVRRIPLGDEAPRGFYEAEIWLD